MQTIPLKRGVNVDVLTELKKLLKKNLEGVTVYYLIHLLERYKTVSVISSSDCSRYRSSTASNATPVRLNSCSIRLRWTLLIPVLV